MCLNHGVGRVTRNEGGKVDWGQISLGLEMLTTPSLSQWEAIPGRQIRNVLSGSGFWKDISEISVENRLEKETLQTDTVFEDGGWGHGSDSGNRRRERGL